MRIGLTKRFPAMLLLGLAALTGIAGAADLSGYYVGKMGGGERLQMSLNQDGSKIEGWYFYERNGGHLELSGSVDSAGRIGLSEFLVGKDREKRMATGEFRGVFDASARTFEGTWRNAGGSKTLKFELDQAAQTMKGSSAGFHTTAKSARPQFAGESAALKSIGEQCRSVAVGYRIKFIKEYANPKDEYLTESKDHAYESSDKMEVQYLSGDLVSVLHTNWCYTGGAHGNSYFRTFNWRIVNGAAVPVKLDDLFAKGSGWEGLLSKAAARELRKCGAQEAINDPGMTFKVDELGAFCFGAKGLTFHFAPYAVDYYAAGAFEVTVPYAELRGVLRGKGALGKFVAAN